MNIENFGLGRTVRSEEKAFSLFPLRSAMPRKLSKRKYRYWNISAWQGDQKDTPQCVAYSWLHYLHAGPITHKGAPLIAPQTLYSEAQDFDEWEGSDYDGSSVNGGAIALHKRGLIKEYRWAFTLEEIIYAVLEIGPVVMGTDRPYGFFFPNDKGILEMKGRNAGGHAYTIVGINVAKGLFKIQNSWGKSWGVNGCAYLPFEHVPKLLENYGEACIPIENKI